MILLLGRGLSGYRAHIGGIYSQQYIYIYCNMVLKDHNHKKIHTSITQRFVNELENALNISKEKTTPG